MSLKWPLLLLLLLIPAVILLWQKFRKPIKKPVFVAESLGLKSLPSYKKIIQRTKKFKTLETAFLAALLVGLSFLSARPAMPISSYNEDKSRDIVLLLDVSRSMEEYIPPMLDTMEQVIKSNPSDRYSIVTFGGLSNTVLPLTRDPVAIQEKITLLRQVYKDGNDPNYRFRGLHGGGTDIGEGVLGAVGRFNNLEKFKSRNVILLSDLEQTGGDFDQNSEFYLERVSLLPKYRINFFVLKTPPEFEWMVSTDIIETSNAKIYEIDLSRKEESVRQLSNDIFTQILNTNTTVGKNIIDYPGPILLVVILSGIGWTAMSVLKRGKK